MELLYEQEQHVRKSFYKSLLNSAHVWSRARLAISKKQNYFWLEDHQLAEDLILVLVSMKGQKKDESKRVSKFVGIKVTIIFT